MPQPLRARLFQLQATWGPIGVKTFINADPCLTVTRDGGDGVAVEAAPAVCTHNKTEKD